MDGPLATPPTATSVEKNMEWAMQQSREALLKAAEAGDATVIRQLLSGGRADLLNAPDSQGFTPLMIAAGNNHLDAVTALLNADAEIDVQNNDGETALWNAAFYEWPKVVDVLLANGADKTLQGKFHGKHYTPFQFATKFGHEECATLLNPLSMSV